MEVVSTRSILIVHESKLRTMLISIRPGLLSKSRSFVVKKMLILDLPTGETLAVCDGNFSSHQSKTDILSILAHFFFENK